MNNISLNGIWLRYPVAHDFTLHLRVHDHTTRFRKCLGQPLDNFYLGSHNFMVMALGSSYELNLCLHYKLDRMMVEGYPILMEEVGASTLGCEISSLLDKKKIARWSTASCALTLAYRPSMSEMTDPDTKHLRKRALLQRNLRVVNKHSKIYEDFREGWIMQPLQMVERSICGSMSGLKMPSTFKRNQW